MDNACKNCQEWDCYGCIHNKQEISVSSRTRPCDTCRDSDKSNSEFCEDCVFNDKGNTICHNIDCEFEEGGVCIAGINCDYCRARIYDEEIVST